MWGIIIGIGLLVGIGVDEIERAIHKPDKPLIVGQDSHGDPIKASPFTSFEEEGFK